MNFRRMTKAELDYWNEQFAKHEFTTTCDCYPIKYGCMFNVPVELSTELLDEILGINLDSRVRTYCWDHGASRAFERDEEPGIYPHDWRVAVFYRIYPWEEHPSVRHLSREWFWATQEGAVWCMIETPPSLLDAINLYGVA